MPQARYLHAKTHSVKHGPGTLPPLLVRLDDPAESLARSVARTRPAEYPREEPVTLADILRGLD